MKQLNHQHLLDLALEVDFKNMLTIGKVTSGVRQIAPIGGGKFSGEKLNGIVLEGNDWVIHQRDGTMLIDVRLTLKTDDNVYIYLKYQGYFSADATAMTQF